MARTKIESVTNCIGQTIITNDDDDDADDDDDSRVMKLTSCDQQLLEQCKTQSQYRRVELPVEL